jgi:hypothetical protein
VRFVFLLAHVRIISMPHGRAVRSAAPPGIETVAAIVINN